MAERFVTVQSHSSTTSMNNLLMNRTVLQSAINLAKNDTQENDEVEITADLLRRVVENRMQYKKAIKDIYGLSEEAKAHEDGWLAQ